MPLGDRARTVALRPLPWKLESPRASRGGVRRGGCFVNRAAEQDSRADAAPAQRFGTDGIKPMGRPSLVTRAFMRVVAFAERLNVAKSNVGTISQDRGWKTFLLAGYGFKSEANIALCPRTWAACQAIPGLITVMFSILEPGKHLPSHRGPYNGVLRLHLGLMVPEPREDLGIRVENGIYRWRDGEAVIFDDAFEHEAWNRTPHTRVVLFVDFRKPLRFPANVLNWLLLNLAVFTPFIREGMDNQKAWEKKFYAEAEALRNRCRRRRRGSAV